MKKIVLMALVIALAGTYAFAGGGGQSGGKGTTITMWMQNAGDDLNRQKQMMGVLTSQFEKETGIKVEIEIGNWTEASQKWMLVATGGDHPDVGDMWWAWSNIQIGKGKYGPMPLDKYKAQLHHERFIPASLADVTWNGSVYGIPWRIDVRPMLYRADLFQQAGIAAPPDTWDDLVTYGKKLTTKAADGRIDISGIGIGYGVKSDSQDFLHWIWQGGAEAMTADGKTATLNSKEVVNSMQFVRDLVYKHEIVTKDVLDPSYNGGSLFISGKSAIRPMGGSGTSDYPKDFLPKVKPAIPTKGVRRTAYAGAGYFGVLWGSTKVDQSVKWLEFLSSDASMLQLAKMYQNFSPSKGASADAYFANNEWSREVVKCLEFAHTSQSPSAAWAQIAGRAPGSPIYDFWADVLLNKEPIQTLADKYNAQAQEMMNKANANK
ncbi:MAG: extracellular solute-binding protein [Treponema sp.]|nr:extracellular solute-binding protein [Treponema sp.]